MSDGPQTTDGGPQAGDRVVHQRFGYGRVIGVSGLAVKIRFAGVGYPHYGKPVWCMANEIQRVEAEGVG